MTLGNRDQKGGPEPSNAPWSAVRGVGAFRDDLSLPQQDIAVLSSWVEGGAPEGDPRYLPATREHEVVSWWSP